LFTSVVLNLFSLVPLWLKNNMVVQLNT